MAGYGYIKISRKADSDPFWLEPRVFSKWEAWEYIIRCASYKPHNRIFPGGEVVSLGRGELVFSLRFVAERWKWTVKRVRGFLETLVKGGRIAPQKRAHQGTVYLVVNYDLYQSPGKPRAQQGHSKGTKEKAGKKDREEIHTLFLEFWDVYPKRRGANPEKKAVEAFNARVAEGVLPTTLVTAVKAYATYCDSDGKTGGPYVQQAQFWLGPKNEGWKQNWSTGKPKQGLKELPDPLKEEG